MDTNPGDGTCSTGEMVNVEGNEVAECTVRAAVAEANSHAGANTINIPAGVYTLTLAGGEPRDAPDHTSGDLDIVKDTTINGAGEYVPDNLDTIANEEAGTVIQAGTTEYAGIDRIFEIWNSDAPTDVAIKDLTVRNGLAPIGFNKDLGGGIRLNGGSQVTLTSVTVTKSRTTFAGGVFVWEGSDLTMIDSTISDNQAATHRGALSIEGADSSATLTDTDVLGNHANAFIGGIHVVQGATLTMTGGRIEGNTAAQGSGGMQVNDQAIATLTGTVVKDNVAVTAGGGITNEGNLTLTGVTMSGNQAPTGAALDTWAGTTTVNDSLIEDNLAEGPDANGVVLVRSSGTLNIEDTTIRGNTANATSANGYSRGAVTSLGGGLTMNRTLVHNNESKAVGDLALGGGITLCCGNPTGTSITNSTITGNLAKEGGGIRSDYGMTLLNVTVADNTSSLAGRADNIVQSQGQVTLKNSLVSGSSGDINCNSNVITQGNNLSSDGTCFPSGGSDLLNTNPVLGPLADNGGPTKTRALADNSPAIDMVPAAACPPPAVDQRGKERPDDGGDSDTTAECDAGAYEWVDGDNDLVEDESDGCVTEAEDRDGIQDADGCPETDADSDGVADAQDEFPLDPSENSDYDNDDTGDNADADDDNDGVQDTTDSCQFSAEDDDGVQDNDGCPESDADNDGTPDATDDFPENANEATDTDDDGIGDNADTDDDNDAQSDAAESQCGSNPKDATSKSPDFDGDGAADCLDEDDDGDLTLDGADTNDQNACVPSKTAGRCDRDRDGHTNDVDNCDKVVNADQKDYDDDGIGDWCDTPHKMTVSLSLSKHLKASGVIKVTDSVQACVADRIVLIEWYDAKERKWDGVAKARTPAKGGTFSTSVGDLTGKYRARIGAHEVTRNNVTTVCSKANSLSVRHVH